MQKIITSNPFGVRDFEEIQVIFNINFSQNKFKAKIIKIRSHQTSLLEFIYSKK